MWTAFFAFTAVFVLILTVGSIVFYRSTTDRRLSQIVVSQNQTAVLTGMLGSRPSARVEKLLHPFQAMSCRETPKKFRMCENCWPARATAKPST